MLLLELMLVLVVLLELMLLVLISCRHSCSRLSIHALLLLLRPHVCLRYLTIQVPVRSEMLLLLLPHHPRLLPLCILELSFSLFRYCNSQSWYDMLLLLLLLLLLK